MPNLLPHFGGLAFLQLPRTNKLIAESGEKHKFWDFEAQIAQIEHKFFDPCLTPEPTLGGLAKCSPVLPHYKLFKDGSDHHGPEQTIELVSGTHCD